MRSLIAFVDFGNRVRRADADMYSPVIHGIHFHAQGRGVCFRFGEGTGNGAVDGRGCQVLE